MKKTIILLSCCLFLVSFIANAQEEAKDSVLRSKKGIPILPKKGDWAIGADALPYLEYLGNIFNNTSGNTLDLGSQTLYGRYFIADNTAVRFLVSINQSSSLSKYYVRDDAAYTADPLSEAKTIDTYKYNYTYYNFDFGYQKFRGYGKLRGFYGFHAGFAISRTRYYYTYGNDITSTNTAPTTYYWGNTSSRTLEVDNGIYKTINAGLIAGVEYYFLPKICVGGEVTLSFRHTWKSQGNYKYETLNNTTVKEYDEEETPEGRTYTSLYTSRPANYGGSLYLMFHF
jgi:hypothetical protein